MRTIINKLCDQVKNGTPFVLCTVLKSEGSAPRTTGACMAVAADGTELGTVGGGRVEYEAAQYAKMLLEAEGSGVLLYRLNPNEIADLGMICGGNVTVLFQHFPADTASTELFSCLANAMALYPDAYFVRHIVDGKVMGTAVLDAAGLHGNIALPAEWIAAHAKRRAVCVDCEGGQALIEPVAAPGRVYLFGGGHVSQKLVPLLHYVGFSVTVCEDRPEFADKALFPEAEETLLCDFERLSNAVSITGNDYVVVMTRGHQADYVILRQALQTDAVYIGCIGSRHKIALTKERLLADGCSEADFSRIHTPIGLPILAETPEEIGVSVTAEMIACRAKHEKDL